MLEPKKKRQQEESDGDIDVATDPGDNLDALGDDLPPDEDSDGWNEEDDEEDD